MTAAEKQAETRTRLIDAATAAFVQRGYHQASLDEISDRAGYSTGAIYSNFDSKEALFLACAERRRMAQLRVWEEFFADAREFGAQVGDLEKVLTAVLPEPGWGKARTEFYISVNSVLSRQAFKKSQREWRNTVARLVDVYCTANGLTPVLPLGVLAESVAALVDGLAYDALIDPDRDIARIFSTTVTVLLGGTPAEED